MRATSIHHSARIMEYALPFCSARDIIALSATRSRVRNDPRYALMFRVLRDTLADGRALDYLTKFCPVSQVDFHEATIPQIAERVLAMSVLRDVPFLADWIERVIVENDAATPHIGAIYRYSECVIHLEFGWAKTYSQRAVYIKKQCQLIRAKPKGLPAKGSASDDDDEIRIVAHLIAAGLAHSAHYSWINQRIRRARYHVRIIVNSICDAMLTCTTNSRACGEWIECWFARDIEGARAIFPFSRDVMFNLYDCKCMEHFESQCHICAQVGPRFAQALMYGGCESFAVIRQFAHDSAEIEQCAHALRDRCALVQDYNQRAQRSRKSWNIADHRQIINLSLDAAAKNPDPLVFARMFAIIRASECDDGICELSYQSGCDNLSRLITAAHRLEREGMRVTFSELNYPSSLAQACLFLPRDEAMRCADFVLSRQSRAQLRRNITRNLKAYAPAIARFGQPFARIIRMYYGYLPE